MRRLAPVPRHLALRVAEVGTVELADAVVGKPGPGADGLRARLVTQEAQRQCHLQPLTVIAIVGDAHAGESLTRECPLWKQRRRLPTFKIGKKSPNRLVPFL